MVELAMINLPQFDVYSSSLRPISGYYKAHKSNTAPTEAEIKKLLPYAKQTKFIIETFHEIVDDLNYDKEKFERIIYKFDDDYDMLKEFTSTLNPVIKSHHELISISDDILNGLMKAQNDLSIIISQHEHQKS